MGRQIKELDIEGVRDRTGRDGPFLWASFTTELLGSEDKAHNTMNNVWSS